jgi:hypothetical protein
MQQCARFVYVPILCLLFCICMRIHRYRKLLVGCAEWSVHGNSDSSDANTSSNSDSHKHSSEQTSVTQQQVTAATIALQLSDTLQSLYTVSKNSSDGADRRLDEDTTAATETTLLTRATTEQTAVQYRADALYTRSDAIAEVSAQNKYISFIGNT